MSDNELRLARTTHDYSLSVGVTADRWRNPGEADNTRLNPANRHTLEKTLHYVLTEISHAVDLHFTADAPKSLFATPIAPVRLISALAEGGDRIAATVAGTLDRPWQLFVITPEDISVLPDRDPHIPLRPLWKSAAERLLLGGRQLDEASLLAVSRVLLKYSTLLVSVWDNQAAQGEAGTENVIKQALAQNIPVVVIDAEPFDAHTAALAATPHAFRVMTPDGNISNDNDDDRLRVTIAMLLARVS